MSLFFFNSIFNLFADTNAISDPEKRPESNNADNMAIYDINTIANYDSEIIKIIENPIGSQFEKNDSGNFIEINE